MIFNKKLFRESTYKILTVLFLIGYNFTPPILAANEILNLDVPVGTEIVQEIDHSEDILEEGISDPEWIAKGEELDEAIEEETPLDVPAQEEEDLLEGIVPNPLLTKPTPANILEELTYPTFVVDEKVATTTGNVEIGKTYIAPQNSKVRVFFTKLPENPSTLTIEEITLTQEEIEATGAVSDKAYDIKTDMVDGTFEYDLTLPSDEENTKVVYVENRAEIFTNIKEINSTVIDEGNTLKIEGLDHFTLFIPANGIVLSVSGSFNGVTQVTVAPSTVIEVDITVQRSENWENNDWESTSWSINGGSTWTCVNTPDNTIGQGTDTESFDITAPATVGTYSVSFRAHRDGSCRSTGVSNTFTLTDGIIVQNVGSANVCNNPSDSYSLSSSGGIWTSVNGGSNVNGQNTEEVKWGNSAGYGQSGLRFDSVGTQTFNENTKFLLGTLTHKNYPINNAANGATLQIKLSFSEPAIGDKTFSYYFGIEETSNSYGGCPSWQQSSTPCDDKITFPNSYGSEVITINDIQYTLVIDGFVDSYICESVGSVLNYFITEEQKNNSAYLVGHLSSVLVERPEIRITKKTNGQDISAAPGETLYIGDTVTWEYVIQNSGNVTLTGISLTDSDLGSITCPSTELTKGASMTCTATGTVIEGQYENTATVTGTTPTSTEVSASDSSWYKGVLKKGHIIVDKVTNPSGDEQSFNFTTTGTGYTGFSLTDGSTPNDQELVAGTYTVSEGSIQGWDSVSSCTSSINDTESAGNLELDPGETIKCIFTNTKLSINVEKTANPTSVPETGGDVEFTIKVKNTSAVAVNLTSLNDDKFGDLNNEGTCFVPQTISAGDSYECKFTKNISGEAGTQHKNIVTAAASGVTDTGDATVDFTDVKPLVTMEKSVTPSIHIEPGGTFTYTLKITNNSEEDVEITTLTDTNTLSSECLALIGVTITPGASKTCSYTVEHTTAGTYDNTAYVLVTDNDGSTASDDDSKTVKVIGARITFKDLTATNDINDPHTFTVKVEQNEGGGWIVYSGGLVSFSLVNNTAGASFVGGVDTCTTDVNGECDIQINSSSPGTVEVHAKTTVDVLEQSISRQTDGTLGSSINATKTYEAGKIIIIKETLPDRSDQEFEFNPSWSDSNFNLKDGEKKDSGWLVPGTYNISESNPEGWYLHNASCSSSKGDNESIQTISLQSNETVTCTFTNYQKGSITVIKDDNIDSGQDFVFDFKPGGVFEFQFTLDDDEDSDLSNTRIFSDLKSTSYEISETGVSGWTASTVECLSDNQIPNDQNRFGQGRMTVELRPGENMICTFTNIRDTGSIKVNKYTDLNGDGDWSDSNEQSNSKANTLGFRWNIDGGSNNNMGSTVSGIFTGNHSVNEIIPSGYHFVSWYIKGTDKSCSNPNGRTLPIKLDVTKGKTKEITICNARDTGTVTIVKDAINNSKENFYFDSNFPSGDFELKDDGNIYNGGTPEKRTFTIPTGSYWVDERDESGWKLTGLSCVGDDNSITDLSTGKVEIDLDSGENVVCTYTNTQLAKVWGFKVNDENGDGDWDFGEWGLGNWRIFLDEGNGIYDGTEVSTLTSSFFLSLGYYEFTNLLPGRYSVCEQLKSSWSNTTPVCQTVDLTPGDIDGLINFFNIQYGKVGVHKYHDINGDGILDENEQGLEGWTMNLYKGSGCKGEAVRSGETDGDGNVAFENIVPGKYSVNETLQSGWSTTTPVCQNIEVEPTETKNVNIGNVILTDIYGVKWNDINGNGKRDCEDDKDTCEPLLSGWTINLFKWNQEGEYSEPFKTTLTDSDEGKGYGFEDLLPGKYLVCEVQQEGWIQTYPLNQMDNCYEISLPTEVEPEYNFGNTKDPLLEIQKSNNKETIDQIPGDEVIYTIIVTAPKREITIDSLARGISQMAENDMTMGNYIIRDVVVSDIAPSGFKYISGSWTAVSTYRGDIKSSILEPEYDGKRSAHWGLGNMEEGEVITLTYKTQISSSTDSGLYPDIAWVKGKSVMDKPVFGNISTGASTPFVGTDVRVIEPLETEGGEVLGATTYLPNTGSKTYLTLASIIGMILGFVTLLLGSQKKYLKKLVLSFVFLFLILPSSIFAYDSLIVKIEQPKTPTGNQSFNIDFTAQDVNEGEITVDCYKNDILFYTTNGNSGVCPVTVESSGTYIFYVIARVGSSEVSSGTVTVVVDLEIPSPVVEYSKTNNLLKFKTANDGRTSMVEIFRSDKSSFLANSSTLIHTMSVVPNTEYTYTDTTAESGKPYFYAIRAVDSLGNVSTIVSDNEVIILPVSTGTTSVTVVANAQGQETATGSEDEGEVAGEKDIDVDGEVEGEKDENIDEEETTKKLTESIKNNWIFWVIGIVALGGIVYIYVQRTKKNK